MPAEPARVEALFEAAVDALEHFSELCVKKESDNAQIAVKNGGVEVSLDAYQALKTYRLSWGSRALRILHALLHGNSNVSLFFFSFPSSYVVGCMLVTSMGTFCTVSNFLHTSALKIVGCSNFSVLNLRWHCS